MNRRFLQCPRRFHRNRGQACPGTGLEARREAGMAALVPLDSGECVSVGLEHGPQFIRRTASNRYSRFIPRHKLSCVWQCRGWRSRGRSFPMADAAAIYRWYNPVDAGELAGLVSKCARSGQSQSVRRGSRTVPGRCPIRTPGRPSAMASAPAGGANGPPGWAIFGAITGTALVLLLRQERVTATGTA